MAAPEDRRYRETHEWHKLEDDGTVTIGISQHAVDELTDVTYVEITKDEGRIQAGEAFGEVESVKATSEIYCGIDGEVSAVNQDVMEKPETLNEDPYGKGWLIRVNPDDAGQLEQLMDASTYEQQS